MQNIVRPTLYQTISNFVIVVGNTPTPISSITTKSDLITSFVLSLDAGAANNVFWGDQNVTINTGIEIVRGAGPLLFAIDDQRQIYESQYPLMFIAEALGCKPNQGYGVPYVVWDLSQIYLIAAAATNVRCAPFRSQFV